MKSNDEVVENICVLFSELVEYGKSGGVLECVDLARIVNVPSNNFNLFLFYFIRRHQRGNETKC